MQKNNVLEITNLLQHWLMFETFGGKALDVNYINTNNLTYQSAFN